MHIHVHIYTDVYSDCNIDSYPKLCGHDRESVGLRPAQCECHVVGVVCCHGKDPNTNKGQKVIPIMIPFLGKSPVGNMFQYVWDYCYGTKVCESYTICFW